MKGANISLLVLLALGVVALAACGSDGDTTVIKTVTESPADQSTTTTAATESTPAPPTSEPTRHLTLFQSPSENIGCYMSSQSSGYARCDIGDRSWSPPARPASCGDLDWGQGVEVSGAGSGQIVCAGDTTRDSGAPVLSYGQSSRADPILCQSSESGVTCTNTDTGHGFLIASESYRLF